jgi:glucose-6-phosphate isomerase
MGNKDGRPKTPAGQTKKEKMALYRAEKKRLKDADKALSDAVVVSAGKGDTVLIPPGYGHVTINPGKKVLVMANIVSTAFSSIYEDYEDLRGAVFYRVAGQDYVKNSRYTTYPQLRHIRRCNDTGFPGIHNRSLYSIIGEENSLRFLNYPEEFMFDTVLQG